MRRFVFSLLIVLTAFRGLVGDAMAYGMTAGLLQQAQHAAGVQNAPKMLASGVNSMPASAHFSSEKTVSMPCHGAQDDAPTNAAPSACTTCQVCHLTASLPDLLRCAEGIAAEQMLNATAPTAWLSAEQQRASKPPIL
ncbi:MAG: hypothetical protein ACKO1L_11210 [Brachymonas sp.]